MIFSSETKVKLTKFTDVLMTSRHLAHCDVRCHMTAEVTWKKLENNVCRGLFYKQVHGAPMGSPVSPGVADLTMEDFEEKVMRTVPEHLKPQVWYCYVDDTFTTLNQYSIEDCTQFLNSRNPHIKFTMETEENDQLPFLDMAPKKRRCTGNPPSQTSILTGNLTTTLNTNGQWFTPF